MNRKEWDPAVSAELLLKGDKIYVERGNTYRDLPGHESFSNAIRMAVCPRRGSVHTRYEYDRMKNAQMGPIGEKEISVFLRVYEEEQGNSTWIHKASEALNGRPTNNIRTWLSHAFSRPQKYPQLVKWTAHRKRTKYGEESSR